MGEAFSCLPRKTESVIKLVQDQALIALLSEYQQQNALLLAEFDKISHKIHNEGLASKIESFDDLKRFDEKSASAFKELAQKTDPIKLEGRSFGFFGVTSTGKSTIINSLLGQKIAEVGAGETTTKIVKYPGENFELYDIPGRNDEMSYFSMEYVAFWKGLTNRLIVITATFKEMTKVLSVLDAVNLSYDIVVNKCDNVPSQEWDQFKNKIKNEAQTLGLKGVKHIWFVSANSPEEFPDWSDLKNSITATNE